MKIRLLKNKNDIYLVELSGVLDLYSSQELKDLVLKMIETRIECIIINLKNVAILGSAGLGALIYISSTLKKVNCPLIVIAPKGPVLNILEVTRLKGFFTVVSSLKEATSLVSKIPFSVALADTPPPVKPDRK